MNPVDPGWSRDFPPVAVFGPVAELTAHADFHAAKRGDFEAACRVVEDFGDRFGWAAITALLGVRPVTVIAYAAPASGNQLPRALAEAIADRYPKRFLLLELIQPARDSGAADAKAARHRAHEKAWDRFVRRPVFDLPASGPRLPYRAPTLLVDDVVTTGGSISELRRFVQTVAELWPIGAAALVSTPRRSPPGDGTRIVPTREERERFHRAVPGAANILADHGIYGGNTAHLTVSELRLLIAQAKLAPAALPSSANP